MDYNILFKWMLILLWTIVVTLDFACAQYSIRWQPGRLCNSCGCCGQPQYINPCSQGKPILTQMGLPAFCDWKSPNSCPSSHWCHVGSAVVTTCCCPQVGDPCNMTVTSGEGTAQLSRWYYDSFAKQCKPFLYLGTKGNPNNFVTKQLCEQQCPVLRNPCPQGEPAQDSNSNRFICRSSNPQTCPRGYWCHIGASPAATACCPPTGYTCQLPRSPGIGQNQLTRWYYDARTKSCQTFIYQGLKGNENNFQSKMDCEIAGCQLWENPCTAPMDRSSAVSCIAGANSCPVGYWCHVGANSDTTICCPGASSPCNQPQDEGLGGASLPRWYYDAGTMSCRQFTYLGLKGNQNNFLSQRNCEISGCEFWENPCTTPMRFSDAISCSADSRNCPVGFWCHIGLSPDSTVCCAGNDSPCRLSVAQGRGQGILLRWYYDAATQSCQTFQYRGLKGNQNNFLTRGDCESSGCRLWQNPCVAVVERATAMSCGRGEQCPSRYWCHRGAGLDTTICCPGAVQSACQLNREEGNGESSLMRWYKDPNDGLCGTCKTFMYRGLKGNQNNFLTRDDCERSCPGCVNPCIDNPLLGDNGRPQRCSMSSPCPLSYFCHIGDSQDTTVCCPSRGDPCGKALAIGSGVSSLPRWYYVASDRRCQQFTYRGLKGNQNNFLSISDCEAICPVWENPCLEGTPILLNDRPRECSSAFPCPSTHFCHLGIDSSTTVCCLSNGDPCTLPTLSGQGSASLRRWSFDARSSQCRQFVYSGLKGNSNNFLSQQDCTATCYIPPNPCLQGSPPLNPSGRPVICSAINPCQAGYWCHVGNSLETTTCCPDAGNPCGMERRSGEGNGDLNRWYFDTQTGRCRQFTYRGTKGNQNNFLSRDDCRQTCPEVNPCMPGDQPYLQDGELVQCRGSSSCPATHFCHIGANPSTTLCCPRRGNPCDQPLVRGTGDASLQRYYFDLNTDECRQFTYSGLQGNENNFVSQGDCTQICPGFNGYCPHGKPLLISRQPQLCSVETACPQDYVCHINTSPSISASVCCPSPDNFCFQQRDRGTCNEQETRFGYEPSSNTCVEFPYSGCGGNLNNFISLEKCTSICCNQFRRRRR